MKLLKKSKLLRQSRLARLIFYFGVGATYFLAAGGPMYFIMRWLAPAQVSAQTLSMTPQQKNLLMLAALGAVLAIGKILSGGEKITLRLMLGRIISGAGLSTIAVAALAKWPNLPDTALIGIGAALGILGQNFLESALRRWMGLGQ